MIAIYEADVADLGAGLNALGGAAHGQVFDGDHAIAILQDVAVGIFYHKGTIGGCGCFIGVPLVATFGAYEEGIHLVGKCRLAEGAWGEIGHIGSG